MPHRATQGTRVDREAGGVRGRHPGPELPSSDLQGEEGVRRSERPSSSALAV